MTAEDSFHRTLDAALAKPHGNFRVDHLVGHTTHTTYHDTREQAEQAARLLTAANVVVWEDPWCAEGCCGPGGGA